MNQRVKLQVNSELPDVPRLSGIMLNEALIDAASLQALVEQISNTLKHIPLSSPEDLNRLKNELENMEVVRILLMKIDSRVGDVASIIGGLHEALTKPREEKEEQKAEQDDNIAAG